MGYFSRGYLCSQALLLAFAPQLGIDPGLAARLAAPFGAGIGRLGGMCGAVTGALFVIGAKYGHQTDEDDQSKEKTFELTRKFITEFEKRRGTVVCRELLGRDLGKPEELERARSEGLFETVCPGFVRDAAEILGELLAADDD